MRSSSAGRGVRPAGSPGVSGRSSCLAAAESGGEHHSVVGEGGGGNPIAGERLPEGGSDQRPGDAVSRDRGDQVAGVVVDDVQDLHLDLEPAAADQVPVGEVRLPGLVREIGLERAVGALWSLLRLRFDRARTGGDPRDRRGRRVGGVVVFQVPGDGGRAGVKAPCWSGPCATAGRGRRFRSWSRWVRGAGDREQVRTRPRPQRGTGPAACRSTPGGPVGVRDLGDRAVLHDDSSDHQTALDTADHSWLPQYTCRRCLETPTAPAGASGRESVCHSSWGCSAANRSQELLGHCFAVGAWVQSGLSTSRVGPASGAHLSQYVCHCALCVTVPGCLSYGDRAGQTAGPEPVRRRQPPPAGTPSHHRACSGTAGNHGVPVLSQPNSPGTPPPGRHVADPHAARQAAETPRDTGRRRRDGARARPRHRRPPPKSAGTFQYLIRSMAWCRSVWRRPGRADGPMVAAAPGSSHPPPAGLA